MPRLRCAGLLSCLHAKLDLRVLEPTAFGVASTPATRAIRATSSRNC